MGEIRIQSKYLKPKKKKKFFKFCYIFQKGNLRIYIWVSQNLKSKFKK